MEEMTAEELRELTSFSQTAYDSKRRLIRRLKAYPQGPKTARAAIDRLADALVEEIFHRVRRRHSG